MTYTAQIIIEREFKTRAAAEQWMERLKVRFDYPNSRATAETHLWEPASPIGAKEVRR